MPVMVFNAVVMLPLLDAPDISNSNILVWLNVPLAAPPYPLTSNVKCEAFAEVITALPSASPPVLLCM